MGKEKQRQERVIRTETHGPVQCVRRVHARSGGRLAGRGGGGHRGVDAGDIPHSGWLSGFPAGARPWISACCRYPCKTPGLPESPTMGGQEGVRDAFSRTNTCHLFHLVHAQPTNSCVWKTSLSRLKPPDWSRLSQHLGRPPRLLPRPREPNPVIFSPSLAPWAGPSCPTWQLPFTCAPNGLSSKKQ